MAGVRNPLKHIKRLFKLSKPYVRPYIKPIEDKVQYISDHDLTPRELSDLISHKIEDKIHHNHETEESNLEETE